ncbi:MAG: hypothetical protein H7Z40_18120 [Phycisphaerae bacterium]|nr:hypothetical protein [Gemmatimonadaceae bacterium]
MSHTHWDREWYHTAGRFRQQLVALVDVLLADAVAGQRPFLLDGQAVVLEDYLHVRPEQAERVGELLRAGAIEAGPWYVLGDGLIPSGEAIIRNLQAGRRVLQQFGAVAPAVAYCPDTFGHSQALPAIAQGFGFPLAIVWRGYGGARAPRGDTVRWRGENGEEILLYHLPPDGYETGSSLPAGSEDMQARWVLLRDMFAERSNTGVVLLPNGADHHALQPDIDEAVNAMRGIAAPDVVVRDSLSGFAQRVVRAASAVGQPLPDIQGELRDSYGYTWTLGGTLGTRSHQKRANAKAERMLLRDVEPWLALAWLHGGEEARAISPAANITLSQASALLNAAWRTLLRAHPHDTLCGCSIDAVARAMDVRIESSVAQAAGLRRAALHMALHHDAADARSRAVSAESYIVLRNRVAYARGGVAELLLDETVCDVPVGPSSGALVANRARNPASPNPSFVRDHVGGLPAQHVSFREVYRRRESPQHYPDNDLVRAHRVLAWVPPVPALGLSVLAVHATMTESAVTNPVVMTEVQGQFTKLSNGLVSVHADAHGVRIATAGRTIDNALTFDTSVDVGDSYTPAMRGAPEPLAIRSVIAGLPGPLRGSIVLTFATAGKRNRVRVRAALSIDANSDTVRVDIRGNNQRRGHRLRVNFHADVARDSTDVVTFADAAFGPVRRDPLNVPPEDQAREMVPATMPMHRWATMTNVNTAATLHSDGLAEVEANAMHGTFSLTLVRAIGELSRNDLPERPGHAGWPAPIPLAQSLGAFHARIGLQLHSAWSQESRTAIETASDSLLLPLVAETMRDYGQRARDVSGPTLSGTGLRCSAVTLAGDRDGIVLRTVNDSPDEQQGSWHIPAADHMEFSFARIDETPTSEWMPVDRHVQFKSPPRGVMTVRVRRRAK